MVAEARADRNAKRLRDNAHMDKLANKLGASIEVANKRISEMRKQSGR